MKKKACHALIAIVAFILIFKISTLSGKAQGEKEQQYKYYARIEVKYGDTLWSIAGQYMDKEHYTRNSYVKEIKSINHVHDENEIKEGQMLIIPYYSTKFVKDEG